MVTVFNNKHLGWVGNISLNHYELIVDDVANLPNDEYYFGPEHKMAQGSIAWVIASAEFYMFDSNGDWVLQTTSGGGGFTPTTEQLTAMNSGIDSTKVAQIATNETNISNLQEQVGYAITELQGVL